MGVQVFEAAIPRVFMQVFSAGILQGFRFLRLEFLTCSGFSSWNSSGVQGFEGGIAQGDPKSIYILDRGVCGYKMELPIKHQFKNFAS